MMKNRSRNNQRRRTLKSNVRKMNSRHRAYFRTVLQNAEKN
ncbi:hypothetical protein [Thalassotalea crassostreae]|nr:hypothetical protein [Thalassotalea crassostreae]